MRRLIAKSSFWRVLRLLQKVSMTQVDGSSENSKGSREILSVSVSLNVFKNY